MSEARTEGERLPWLDTPRAPKPAVPRRKLPRAPIFVLLSLFLLASIGLMSFLVGRVAEPIASAPAPSRPVQRSGPTATVTLPAPSAAVPLAPVPAVEEAKSSPAPRATPPRHASAKPKASQPSRARPARRPARTAEATPRAIPAPVRRVSLVPPPVAGRSGRMIQLGAFTDPREADAAWHRLTRAYPYLGALPKIVAPTRPPPGDARLYRLQLGARSNGDALALCRKLVRIGRSCIVL